MQSPVYSFKNNIKSAILLLYIIFAAQAAYGDWVSDANARIEQIRKGNFQIKVVDSNGSPVNNVYVQINQVRHRFAFGSCIAYGALSGNANYRNFFLEHFEWAVCENEMKWASNESTRDKETYSSADYIANWCASNGIILRGHNLVWETGAQMPSWLSSLNCNSYPNPSERLEEIDERIVSAVSRYKGRIVQWDIDNEMLSGSSFSCLGESGRAHFFTLANLIDPNCGMYMNEYSGNSFGSYDGDVYANRAKGLIALGGRVEGLGIQGHVNSPFQPEKYYNNVLQELAVVGLPIIATEYDTDATTEAQRANDLENFYRICFSHPNVEGIIMWGFWKGSIWRGNGLANNDWTLNAAGVRYEKLLEDWTTKDSNFTDVSGNANFRGFHGKYEVTLSTAGKPDEVFEIELTPSETTAEFIFDTNFVSIIPVKNINNGKEYIFIQDAITDADPCNIIIVSPGTYYENINFIGKHLTLSSSDPNNPEIVASTIIKGSNKAVVFSNNEDANSIITGLTITDANTGIYCEGTSPTISKCRIIENKQFGILLESTSCPNISYCEILCSKGSGIAITGGRYSYKSMPSINHCVIAANRVYGIYCATPVISNCTIAANGRQGIAGSSPTVTNSIIYYNSRNTDNIQIDSSSAIVTYSDIQGGWDGIGNVNQDPCFAETGVWNDNSTANDTSDDTWLAGDYHLKSQVGRWDPNSLNWVKDNATSPCIDTGDPNSDWSGELWPNGKRINMGAYGGSAQASLSLSDEGDIRDINSDGTVTWNDVLRLAGKWSSQNAPLKEDLNLDGRVDVNDLIFFNGNWQNDSNNSVPQFVTIENKNVTTGDLISFAVSASDTDGDELVYLAAGLPVGADFTEQIFTWTPEQAGIYPVTFIVSDYKSLAYKTIQITVSDQQ
jgi:GH35 family endo-1,4-beta-xylanase